ncbi:MAG: hypothetical protein ACLGI9_23200, partial [Thermoanaerobaculia bacterium]
MSRLQEAIREFPREERGFLLAVKRDAFNGRPISRHRQGSRWPLLEEAAGPLANAIADLEQALETAESE